jgi:hypothetical protein
MKIKIEDKVIETRGSYVAKCYAIVGAICLAAGAAGYRAGRRRSK